MSDAALRKRRPVSLAFAFADPADPASSAPAAARSARTPPSPSPSPSYFPTAAPVIPTSPAGVAREAPRRQQSHSVSYGSSASSFQLLQSHQQTLSQQQLQQQQQQYQAHLASIYQHHQQSQMMTPPEEFAPQNRPVKTKSCSCDLDYSDTPTGELIDTIIDDKDDDVSVAAAASLLMRHPTSGVAGESFFLDPEAFSDDRLASSSHHTASSSTASASAAACPPDSAGSGGDLASPDSALPPSSTPASASSSSASSPAQLSKSIFKKMVPAKIRAGIKRRMSAPISLSSMSLSMTSPSTSSPFAAASASASAVTPLSQTKNPDGYFDIDIASNTNLEFDGSSAPINPATSATTPSSNPTTTTSSTAAGSVIATPPGKRNSPILPPTDPTHRMPNSPTHLSQQSSPIITTSASTPHTHTHVAGYPSQSTVSPGVLAASAAMSAIMSSSPPIPPSPLAGSRASIVPELCDIPTPLSPTPIQTHAESLSETSSAGMTTASTPTGAASAARASSITTDTSSLLQAQQLHTRLQVQLRLQEAALAGTGTLPLSQQSADPSTPTATTTTATQTTSRPTSGPTSASTSLTTADEDLAQLYENMRVEDQAFEATESRLEESGWTSEADLAAIRKDRVAARKRWEAAIAAFKEQQRNA
ncbi:hypothetical protein BZA70DRAFT_62217 [Myxozyma melibiosi]|uniref:Uncharacterized protein n=1 Tax=Myxozyma melibiosi TaxID=54550 RepID=A0ABR1F216_9ASCO